MFFGGAGLSPLLGLLLLTISSALRAPAAVVRTPAPRRRSAAVAPGRGRAAAGSKRNNGGKRRQTKKTRGTEEEEQILRLSLFLCSLPLEQQQCAGGQRSVFVRSALPRLSLLCTAPCAAAVATPRAETSALPVSAFLALSPVEGRGGAHGGGGHKGDDEEGKAGHCAGECSRGRGERQRWGNWRLEGPPLSFLLSSSFFFFLFVSGLPLIA